MSQARGGAWWQRLFSAPPADSASGGKDLGSWESPDRAIAFGQRIIFFGLAVFVAWATLAPIDEGIPAPGAVAVESGRKAIVPLSSGRVAQLNVTENQHVKAGDVLVAIDDVQPQAIYDSAVQQHFAMAAKLARLEAEQRREKALRLPEELQAFDKNEWARELLVAEVSLLASRNESFENEMAILRERVAAAEEKLRGSRQQLAARRQQHDLLSEQVRGLTKLVEAGHTPRNQLLDTQRTLVEVARMADELESAIVLGANSVSELRLMQNQRRREIQRDLETEIVAARRELAPLMERMKAAQEDVARMVIKAPIAGQIVALQGLAVGGTVSAGMHLMDLIPEGERLLVDVQIAPHIIDRVSPGLAADVRINAFPEEPQLVVDGRVASVSGDQLKNPATGQAYFLARIEVTPEGLRQLGQRQIRPGMPVEAIIKTGERSFMAYLVKPIMRRLFSAFRET